MRLRRFGCMMRGMLMVAVGGVRVMRSLFVIASLLVSCRFVVVMRGMFEML
jgi:hypothetical protein